MRTATLGVDVGGTKTAGALVTADGEVLGRRHRPTAAADGEACLATIAAVVRELCAAHPDVSVTGVGLAFAGLVDAAGRTVLHAPNIAGLDEVPVADRISAASGLPVVVENDAHAAAMGELAHAAPAGARSVVVVTVGTGIGGALVLDGVLQRGDAGVAGEIGHLTMEYGGRPCSCGGRGCWEQYASGTALVTAARAWARELPQAAALLLSLAGSPEAITGRDVTSAAREGDSVALAAFEETGAWLGRGLASLAAVLDPGAFVIGGGVVEAGDLLLAPALAAFEEALLARGHRPTPAVVAGTLGNDAGMLGAALLARSHHHALEEFA